MKSIAVYIWIVGLFVCGNAFVIAAFGFYPRQASNRRQHHVRKLSSSAVNSNISGSNNISINAPSGISWEVFVSQANKSIKDKGVLSASSVMESFASFSPSPGAITVNAAFFTTQPNKAIGKGKGHLVRCIQKKEDLILSAIEINNVDSVEK
eukprot:scaffold7202_cov109-Skeletonema_dohrnii-CCMP3373.AAC.5